MRIVRSRKSPGKKKNRTALDKLSGRDRLGSAAHFLTTAGGAAAGFSAAGSVAAAAGASTLLGSTTLAAVLGGVFVTSTPIGWVIGTAAVGAAAGYGLSALAKSGGRQNRIREELIKRLSSGTGHVAPVVSPKFIEVLVRSVARGAIPVDKAAEIGSLVLNGLLDPKLATDRLEATRY